MKSGNNSLWTKLLFAFSLFTAISPIDALPDLIPILGQVDDVIAIPLMIALGLKMLYTRRQQKQNDERGSRRGGSDNGEHRGFEHAKYAGEDLGGDSFYNPGKR